MRTDGFGAPLVPGYNVDVIDMTKGLDQAREFGFDPPEHQMVVSYALWRHSRGEEPGAEQTALSGGIDFTSWRVILAAACADGFIDNQEKAKVFQALGMPMKGGRR